MGDTAFTVAGLLRGRSCRLARYRPSSGGRRVRAPAGERRRVTPAARSHGQWKASRGRAGGIAGRGRVDIADLHAPPRRVLAAQPPRCDWLEPGTSGGSIAKRSTSASRAMDPSNLAGVPAYEPGGEPPSPDSRAERRRSTAGSAVPTSRRRASDRTLVSTQNSTQRVRSAL